MSRQQSQHLALRPPLWSSLDLGALFSAEIPDLKSLRPNWNRARLVREQSGHFGPNSGSAFVQGPRSPSRQQCLQQTLLDNFCEQTAQSPAFPEAGLQLLMGMGRARSPRAECGSHSAEIAFWRESGPFNHPLPPLLPSPGWSKLNSQGRLRASLPHRD